MRAARRTVLHRILRSESPKLSRPVRALGGYLRQRTSRSAQLLIRRDGYVLPFFARSDIALTYWAVPELVDPTETFLRQMVRSGDTVVDVGANVGAVAMVASRAAGRTGRVIAIEPHPVTHANLVRTLSVNDTTNVMAMQRACGAIQRTAVLSDQPRTDDRNHVCDEGSGVPVEMTTLRSLLDELGVTTVDVLKIDVEGFEHDVLVGLGRPFPPIEVIYVEVVDSLLRRAGGHRAEVIEALVEQGYTCYRNDSDPLNIAALASASRRNDLAAGWVPVAGSNR